MTTSGALITYRIKYSGQVANDTILFSKYFNFETVKEKYT